MTEDELIAEAKLMPRWQQHRFMILVFGTVVISLFLVAVSLVLYSSSGAAQVDLSRPGYQSVRAAADRSVDPGGFPATGTLDKRSIDTFRALYDVKMKQLQAVDAFGGDVMSDSALSISAPAEGE